MKSLLKKIDELAPNPWYVEGVKQARPIYQIFVISSIIIGFIIVVVYY